MEKIKPFIFYIVLSFLYLFIFVLIYGAVNFDIHYTDWCLIKHSYTNSEDISLNYLNFFAFLNDFAPLPYYENMISPYRGSLLYIDYVPFLALIVKIFYRYILNINSVINIQYAWYFGAFAFVIQGILAYKIIKKITNTKNINAIISSIFFVIAPVLIMRFPYHFTLCAQFLILLSFYPFVFEFKKKQLFWFYFLLGFLGVCIFIYFLPFIFINLIAYILYKTVRKEDILFYFSLILALGAGALIPFYIFHGNALDLLSYGTGYSYFNANLNTFINPVNMYELFQAKIFPFLNSLELYTKDQNEGFGYLGGGVLLLIVFSFVILFKKYKLNTILEFIKKYKQEFCVFVFVFIISFLIASSFKITLGGNLLFQIELPKTIEKLFAIFRTSGRLIWNDVYLIYFVILIFLIKNISRNKITFILLIGLCAQIYDLAPAFVKLNKEYNKKVEYNNFLDNNKVFRNLIKGKNYIVIFNFYPFDYFDFAQYAIKNKLKINNLQLSRDVEYQKFYDNLAEKYKNIDENILYVFSKDDLNYIKKTNLKYCYFLNNDFIACTKNENKNFKNTDFKNVKNETSSSEAYRYFLGYIINNEEIDEAHKLNYRY